MTWSMRYTFHTGYEPPACVPQFRATLGSADPVATVRFAAREGVAGVLYPWAADRPPSEIAAMSAALKDTGLAGSCIVIGESPLLFRPLWTDRSPAGRATLAGAVERCGVLAAALHTRVIVAFPVSDPARAGEDPRKQSDDLVASLAEMAPLAGAHGCAIAIEPMLLPGLMLQSFGAALDIVRRVADDDVGLIFDTAHVVAMGDDLTGSFRDGFDHMLLLQFADMPGRVEPGAGSLDLVAIGAEATVRGYSGLVDFEHGWSDPSPQGEVNGLARVHDFDEQVRAATAIRRNAVTSLAARPN